MDKIYLETKDILNQLVNGKGKFRNMNLCVVACSISKVEGQKIDTVGNPEIARNICDALWQNKPENMNYAIQCCEHLNRALIVERNTAEGLKLEEVLVYPVDRAGGTFATVAYGYFKDPVIVESIEADGGIDIGLNLIGMHLKKVAQPLLLENDKIGAARVVAARTRLKLIGGARAVYDK